MRQSMFFTMLSAFLLSAPVTPLPFDQGLNKRSYTGRGTWFNDGLGACGYTNGNSDLIVALSSEMYDSGAYCGKSVTITDTTTGATASGTVVDLCPGCGAQDLDMSMGLFERFAALSVGVVEVTWNFA